MTLQITQNIQHQMAGWLLNDESWRV
jgi:hypothetical protein